MNMPRNLIGVVSILINVAALAAEPACDDGEYREFLEDLDCSSVVSGFRGFLEEAGTQLDEKHPTQPEQLGDLVRLVERLENHEELLGHCLVKHAEPDDGDALREIYISATFAVMSLRRWIVSRPADEFFEQNARSKFSELQESLDKDVHNKAFNTDAGKACAG